MRKKQQQTSHHAFFKPVNRANSATDLVAGQSIRLHFHVTPSALRNQEKQISFPTPKLSLELKREKRIDPAEQFLKNGKARLYYESKVDAMTIMQEGWEKRFPSKAPLSLASQPTIPERSFFDEVLIDGFKTTMKASIDQAVQSVIPKVFKVLSWKEVMEDINNRSHNSLATGKNQTENMICAAIGEGSSLATSAGGTIVVYKVTFDLVLTRVGAGAAGMTLILGNGLVNQAATKTGDMTQSGCHATFKLIQELRDQHRNESLSTPSSLDSPSPSSPGLK